MTLPGKPYLPSGKHYGIVLGISISLIACEDKVKKDSIIEPPSEPSMILSSSKKEDKVETQATIKAEAKVEKTVGEQAHKVLKLAHNHTTSKGELELKQELKSSKIPKSDSAHATEASKEKSSLAKTDLTESKSTKKTKKKPSKCRRGIHKGHKRCKIERGHISLYHINRGKRQKSLRLIDDQRRVIPEAREIMLEFLGDWRSKKKCKKGFSFNYEYKGRASWRMYDCYVQDRLLWYLYLIGHHFDSEIQIVSGLRAHERKTSRHHNGHAVDFRVKGVKAKEVWEYSKKTFPLVGIGYYPKTKFVHLDVGRDHHQAYWIDRSGSGESASYKAGVSQVQRGRAKKSQSGMISSIKRSLKRHYKSFKSKQKVYLERKKRRAERAKRRKRKRRTKKR